MPEEGNHILYKHTTWAHTEAMNLIELTDRFNTDEAARDYIESLRWPGGPVCPHCGSVEAYKITPRKTSKRPARPGLYTCKACRKQFTVTVGTIFERSHVPLRKWVIAIHLMCASRKGISAHQIHRMLGVTYKTAWFMAHRIREAMREMPDGSMLTGTVEADETYVGGKARPQRRRKTPPPKTAVLSVVQRDGGVRSTVPPTVTRYELLKHLRANVDASARVISDDAAPWRDLYFGSRRDIIRHSDGQYVVGDVTTNSVESYFALLKRGIHGTFHHVSAHHLHRYLTEFDFRYTWRKIPDGDRAALTVRGASGKRLMYR